LKERLLGAAVLIVAAVILIPVVLDGPRSPDTESRQLTLPAPDADKDSRVRSDSTRTHTVEIGDKQQSRPQEDRRVNTLAVVGEEDSPPSPVPPVQRSELQTASSGDSWAVQVGSFSSESNARRLVEHLKESEYTAFVVRNVVNGRLLFRVRVGPEPDRGRAEALAERLRSDRQQTQLVSHP